MLVQIIYASRAVQPFADRDLVALLQKCRDKNRRLGITGMLVYKESTFLQVLEGEPAAIELIWQAIAADPRHDQIYTLRYQPIPTRDYAEWTMGFFNASWNGCAELPGYARFQDMAFSPEYLAAHPERAREFLLWIRSAGE